jgi:hypothetical protein
MAGVGCALPCLPLLLPFLNILTSGRHVLPLADFDNAHACCRSTCLSRCCTSLHNLTVTVNSSYDLTLCVQVFYGRYLKKLSNQTQEAMGEMTKVVKPIFLHSRPSSSASLVK